MLSLRGWVALGLMPILAGATPAGIGRGASLAVWRSDGAWHTFWRADDARRSWRAADGRVASSVQWEQAGDGVEYGELRLAGTGEAWRLRVALVRLDPRRVRLSLAAAIADDGVHGRWTIDSAGSAVVAFNGGQFTDATPWGWLVHDGTEYQPPGVGPLSMALAIDRDGGAQLATPSEIERLRESGRIVEALQSYPTLLVGDGDVPTQLLASGRGIDVEHRDARLAIGELRDGRLLVALTRFDALGDAFSVVPFGPTVPEMAALLGALGARRAMMLDGGLSSQLVVRGGDEPHRWPGLRRVPLAVVALGRQERR
jgi:hypothetical protein